MGLHGNYYNLKEKVSEEILETLNTKGLTVGEKLLSVLARYQLKHQEPSVGQLRDWVDAISSGVKIANSLSTEQRFHLWYKQIDKNDRLIVNKTLHFVTEKNPEFLTWIKEEENDE